MSPARKPIAINRLLRLLWLSVGAAGLALVVSSFWMPEVDPVMPGSTAMTAEELVSAVQVEARYDGSFVARPLFMNDRRPASGFDPGSQTEMPIVLTEVEPKKIEGVTLLGVFSSAGVSGVILSEAGRGQRRLTEGDRLQGWTLTNVESRAAVFQDGDRIARVDMALVSKAPQISVEQGRGNAPSTSDGDGEEADEKLNFAPTFETMYRSKARATEIQADSNGGSPETAQQGGKDDE